MSQRSSLTDGAAAMGRQRGRDAAAWVFNGAACAGSGDGALIGTGASRESFPSCGCAGGRTGAHLAAYAGTRRYGEDRGGAAGVYQEAASAAFWDELERLCGAYLTDDGPSMGSAQHRHTRSRGPNLDDTEHPGLADDPDGAQPG